MCILPFEKKDKQAVIFIGIQASGKTTFYNQMLSDGTYTHISLDDLHTRNKERQEMILCLENGHSFVIDNTNPETSDRTAYIQIATEYGYHVVGLFFQSQVKECVRRNEDQKRMSGISNREKNEILFERGINYNDLPLWQKRGVGMYYRDEQRQGYNPVTKESTSYTRRSLHIEMELPIGQEYSQLISAIIEDANKEDRK